MLIAAQVRAARALLQWSQDELCERAGVSHRTLAMLETQRTVPYDKTLGKLKAALEAAGVVFVQSNDGVGVLLRPDAAA